MRYGFEERGEGDEAFHPCQRHAIETAIYCHEVLQIKTLRDLFEKLAPEVLLESE